MADPSSFMFRRRIASVDEPSELQVNLLLQLETSDESDNVRPFSEQGGLFCIHEPEDRGCEAVQYTSDVDIIAVHGLGGDAHRTWQHENGFNWLQRLHEEFSGVRIYTFGYDSGAAFSGNPKGLHDHARYLLCLVKKSRSSLTAFSACLRHITDNRKKQQRKIVFVCHGVGGLLVRQALLLANNEEGVFGSLRKAFRGILFFGTPHAGTWTDNYETTLCRMADTLLFPNLAEKLMEAFRQRLLDSLKNIAIALGTLDGDFTKCTSGIHISSFVETVPLPGMSVVLVEKHNSFVGRSIPMLDHDHRQICKHPSFATLEMSNILDELREITQGRSRVLARSQTLSSVGESHYGSYALEMATSSRNDALLKAASSGNVRAVERLINQGVELDTCNSHGETAFLLACQHGYSNMASQLLDAGADKNRCDERGNSSLHFASRRSDQHLAMMILSRGGDPNLANKSGATPLHEAAEHGNTTIVRCLLNHGADCFVRNSLQELPARIARRNHQLEVMRVLHSHAQDMIQEIPRLSLIAGWPTSSEVSNRFWTRSLPSMSIAQFDPDSKLKRVSSTLSQLAQRGELRAVEDLLDRGVKPTAEALYLAAIDGHSDIVRILTDTMDDIDVGAGFYGNALCGAASQSRSHDCLKVLLEKGADVNWLGGHYGCALQSATAHHRLDNVILLLRYGADVNAQCGHYGNVMTAAARHGTNFTEMATLFLEHGADIDAQGPGVYGNALQTAVWLTHMKSIEFLIRNGASPTIEGRFGSARDIFERNAFRFSYVDKTEEKMVRLLLTDEDPDELFEDD